MRGLPTLIRMFKEVLDERRRHMSDLEYRRETLIAERVALERAILDEQGLATKAPEYLFSYGPFADRSIRDREALEARKRAVEVEIETVGEQVSDAYRELKKYETALNLRQRREEAEAARRENNELDEIGLDMYRRRDAGAGP
ncbi:MAG: hypothetical protein QF926_09510 [Alphaproteobacteria bacterium]|nr:hypothetical protein [Alphaproteobacteria bacterium]MDP6516841.1 hypothetical protein [Alphaproteobacteria bacterium]